MNSGEQIDNQQKIFFNIRFELIFTPLNHVHLGSNHWEFGICTRQGEEWLISLCMVLSQLLPVDWIYASDG